MYFTPKTYPHRRLDSAQTAVTVVGGGPVGLTLALGLARRGCRVAVIEADDSACLGSRAICVSRHSLEILDRIGVSERFRKAVLPWTSGRSYYGDTEVLAFDMPQSEFDVFPPMVNVSQSMIEQLLIDATDEVEDISIHWSSRVTGCEQSGDSVVLDIDTPEGRVRHRSDWVVAADGARSTMRELLGLRLSGTSYEGRYVIADIHWPCRLSAERRVWFDPPSAPGTTLILHRQPDDIWRVDYQLGPDDDPDVEVAEHRIRERIERHLAWLGENTPWTLEWSSIYRAHALSLENYRHDRVLFAGDAAHLVPIFGVRGLNSGMEDADSLSWMLPLVVRGEADDSLLDAWAAERRDAWEQNIGQADLSTRFMTPGTHGYQLTRDAVLALAAERPELRELINPRQSSATHVRRSRLTVPFRAGDDESTESAGADHRPGDPVVDIPVDAARRDEAGADSLFGLARGRFIVLALGVPAEEAAALTRSLAGYVGGENNVVAVADELLDRDATQHLLSKASGESVVIRPDGLVMARIPRGQTLDLSTSPLGCPVGSSAASADAAATPKHDQTTGDLEQIWTRISEAIDEAPNGQRERVLTRLVLSLAFQHCSPAQVGEAIGRSQLGGAIAETPSRNGAEHEQP